MLERKYFSFFSTYYEAAQHLSAKDRAAFYEAVINYSFSAKVPNLKGQAEMCWILVKPYLEKSMEDFMNGSKGGRPRKNKNPGFPDVENPGFEILETPVSFSPKTKKEVEVEKEKEVEQQPTATPAAVTPPQGRSGGKTLLDSGLDNSDRDAATEAARQQFLDSIIRPAWPAADAAAPDVMK